MGVLGTTTTLLFHIRFLPVTTPLHGTEARWRLLTH